MPADERIPARPSLRERRRATATREIVEAAERQITEHGPAALSLRAVARELDMTVQALYHYFPSRDALVTELITRAYDDLADAVRTAVETPSDEEPPPGVVLAAEGYRRWAIDHPERFQLIYGTPLRHYEAPVDGPTTRAVQRMAAIFERELFAGCTAEQLARADVPPLSPAFRAYLEAPGALPAPAGALFLNAWGHLHGLVVLEVFGHTDFLGDHQAEIFRLSIHTLYQDLRRRIPAEE
ncbi:TetR/AcrR family transcriptional regulator [Streptomyces profundus]|uniref:TetR/AcrR family transcriptional regulator n=1 Tax=Streptomyces profundus TaxID=2867410 RepID=UPI001D15F45B|nr:TetR/AcrR family transcriptional regulator [Streptomyces sp. MA3_2.13]UED84065.1 TetR/AcrR family transcriptional regulator [Streptomyces sp. MA3_2.13]